jgi:hypothetical protein
MTDQGKVEQKDVVDTISAIASGVKTSYAVLSDSEVTALLPVIGSTIQGLEINVAIAEDESVKHYLSELKSKLERINVSIQIQLVRNATITSKIALA